MAHPAVRVRVTLSHYVRWRSTTPSAGVSPRMVPRHERRSIGCADRSHPIAAFRAALEERTRERVPLSWATTQTNLGEALVALGERESNTTRLEGAIAAYRAAQAERKRERGPFEWAKTQEDLAIVFRVLATRSSSNARGAYLQDALEAADGALEVYRAGKAGYYIDRGERLQARILAVIACNHPQPCDEAGANFHDLGATGMKAP
jgi:hypothetical protein